MDAAYHHHHHRSDPIVSRRDIARVCSCRECVSRAPGAPRVWELLLGRGSQAPGHAPAVPRRPSCFPRPAARPRPEPPRTNVARPSCVGRARKGANPVRRTNCRQTDFFWAEMMEKGWELPWVSYFVARPSDFLFVMLVWGERDYGLGVGAGVEPSAKANKVLSAFYHHLPFRNTFWQTKFII